MPFEDLTDLERTVLQALVAQYPAVATHLQRQIQAAHVLERRHTGVGFFTDVAVPVGLRCADAVASILDAPVRGEIEGLDHGMTFLAFTQDGLLTGLEGAVLDGGTTDLDLPRCRIRLIR